MNWIEILELRPMSRQVGRTPWDTDLYPARTHRRTQLGLIFTSLDFTYEMKIFHKEQSVKQIGSKEVDS